MKTDLLYDYVERLGEVLRVSTRQAGAQYGLQPVQIQVLRYLSICNRFSNTPMGVTEYLGQTKGTISQTIKVLEKKGYLAKCPDALDKRVAHLQLTHTGKVLLKKISLPPSFNAACAGFGEEQIAVLGGGLEVLLRELLRSNSRKSFGLCHTCRYNTKTDVQTYTCSLLKIKLTRDDTRRICREHSQISENWI